MRYTVIIHSFIILHSLRMSDIILKIAISQRE